MKSLKSILESLFDAINDDKFTPEEVSMMNVWNALHSDTETWREAMGDLLRDMEKEGLKKIRIPRSASDPYCKKYDAIISKNEYFLFVVESVFKDKLLLAGIAHGNEKFYIWDVPKPNQKGNVTVSRMNATTPRHLLKDDISKKTLYYLPKKFVWLYDKMVEEYNRMH